MFLKVRSSPYSKASDPHTLYVREDPCLGWSLGGGIFTASNTLSQRWNTQPSENVRDNAKVCCALTIGWSESLLQKTFEGESSGGKGQGRRTVLMYRSKLWW